MYQKILMAIVMAGTLGACASGTQVSSGGEVAAVTPATRNYLPPGTSMIAQLDRSVSTSSHDGDGFTATVTDNVYADDGTVAIPAGAVVRGHVTGAHTAKIPGEQNVIRLDFDNLAMRGRTYPFNGSISNVDVKGGGGTSSHVGRNAAIGGAAGAVLGGILSGGEVSKMITGGLLGAAAGTVISLGTGSAGTEAVIPAGSLVTIRSNEGVQVR